MSALTDPKEVQQSNVSSGGGIGGCGGCATGCGVVLLVIFLFLLWIYIDTQKRNAEYDARRNRVSASQLVFTDLNMGPIGRTYSSNYKLTGRVKNTSSYKVSSFIMKVRIFDCNAQSHCDIVGETYVRGIGRYPGIPSGQVRDIDESVFFDKATQIRGRFKWDYQITEVSSD